MTRNSEKCLSWENRVNSIFDFIALKEDDDKMDIIPIYELQSRLRAAAIAGARLLPEDFRLRRAAEAVMPLAGASLVLEKLNEQMTFLLSGECENPAIALLNAISLTEAVLCTLGAVEVSGEIKDLDIQERANTCTENFPCSQLRRVIEAFTGSGDYMYVYQLHLANSEVFKDYRVRPAMVRALGASYAYTADLAKMRLVREDASILPLLKKGFDPKGKREMRFRLEVITAVAGSSENEFYLKILPDAEREIRTELIRAIGQNPANMELLFTLANTERGRNKQLALDALAEIPDEKVYAFFEKMAVKKPEEACEHLLVSTTKGASKLISGMCLALLPEILEMQEDAARTDSETRKIKRFCRCVEALVGKSGDDVIQCYQLLLDNQEKLGRIAGGELDYLVLKTLQPSYRDDKHTWEETIARHLADSLAVNDNRQLAAFVMEQYAKSDAFLMAAAVAKMYEEEDCTAWFDAQLQAGDKEKRYAAIIAALKYVIWDNSMHKHITEAAVRTSHYHSVSGEDKNRYFRRVVHLPNRNRIMDWLMKNHDRIMDCLMKNHEGTPLIFWVDRDNKAERERIGEWYYNRFFEIKKATPDASQKIGECLFDMRWLQWKKCTGLAEQYAMQGHPFEEDFFEMLPCSRADAQAEMDAFIRLIEENKVEGIPQSSAAHYKKKRDKALELYYI